MQIILLRDIPKLGNKEDIVNVKNGYANNYLIPQGLARLATPSAQKAHQENIKQQSHKEQQRLNEAQELAAKIEGTNIVVSAKVSSTGKIFGSINTIQLADALAQKNLTVDRRQIAIQQDSIKELGNYTAEAKLYKNVVARFTFEVVAAD